MMTSTCRMYTCCLQVEDRVVEEHLQHKVAKYSGPTDAGPLPITLLRIKIHDCVIASPDGVRLTGVLADIMAATTPSQRYVRFYEAHLSRCLVQVLAAPARYVSVISSSTFSTYLRTANTRCSITTHVGRLSGRSDVVPPSRSART